MTTNAGYDLQMAWDPLDLACGFRQHFPPLGLHQRSIWVAVAERHWLHSTITGIHKVAQNLA